MACGPVLQQAADGLPSTTFSLFTVSPAILNRFSMKSKEMFLSLMDYAVHSS